MPNDTSRPMLEPALLRSVSARVASWLQMDDYTSGAKVYWWTIIVLGGVVLALSANAVAHLHWGGKAELLLGVLLATITGMYPVRVPGSKTSGSVAEIFIFLLLLDVGPEAAVIAAAAESGAISWRTSKRWTSRFGSPAMTAISMGVCGTVFAAAKSALVLSGHWGAGSEFTLLLALALAYFASGTLLVASLFNLKKKTPIRPLLILREHSWLAVTFAGSGSLAGMFDTTFGYMGLSVLPAAAPVIAVLLFMVHRYVGHVDAESAISAERIENAERAAGDTSRRVRELHESEERFESAFNHAAVGMVLVSSDGHIVQVNESAARLLGRNPSMMSGWNLMDIIQPDDRGTLREQIDRLFDQHEETFSTQVRCVHERGVDVCVSASGALFVARPPLNRCLILQLQDMSARRHAEARLEYMSRAMQTSRRHPDRRYAVLILDFDRFKLVNDSLGHSAGDQLLVEIARRLESAVRSTDVLARLGGDEFAILLEDRDCETEAVRLAERVRTLLAMPVYLQGVMISTSASIGITTCTFGYETPEEVLRDADTAMYRAKSQPNVSHVVFDSALHAEVAGRLWIENELRRAIANDDLFLNYQPICDLVSGTLTGFEALARWDHAERGSIPPDRFIRIAEETGQIVPLGTWALQSACRQLAQWQSEITMLASVPKLSMNVNVSGLQLAQPDFCTVVIDAIAGAGIDPSQLTIELTESILLVNLGPAQIHLRELQRLGVRISIDDFGTGYSSFATLGKLPIDSIKIDKSFIAIMGDDWASDAVVAGIVALAHSLGKTLVAEGIENPDQLARLAALGCQHGQGYLLGRPTLAAAAEPLMRGSRRLFAPPMDVAA
jgi:diguanylate cyclase (GGDEF)-like protein